MKIHWKALLLAPAAIPAVYSLLAVLSLQGGDPVWAFLFFFVLGSFVSYAATVGLLLPALHVLSRVTLPTWPKVAISGALLGVIASLPLEWVMWRASGDDSGPPSGPFIEMLLHDATDPIALAFPIGGLVTAALYWALSRPRQQRTATD